MTLVSLEGIDGAGKTTVWEALGKEFDCILTREPTETWLGEQVRRALQEETAPFTDFFLFMADRHQHTEDFIKPKVAEGELVISDRYVDSTLAYQPVQFPDDMEHPIDWILDVMRPWLLYPDLTIYIDISVETAMERADKNEKYETREFLEQVRRNYQYIANMSEEVVMIDGERNKQDVIDDAVELVRREIQ